MFRTLVLLAISIALWVDRGSSQDPEIDLYSLVLAPIDLTEATRTMTVCDLDEDGFISGKEQDRLVWNKELAEFDLNKDRKLAHLEVVIRHAKVRTDAGVEQVHINNAKTFLNRHDQNRNGQLDPDEIANGWPSEPEQFDTNRDGVITLSEMAARFAFMAGLRREMGIEQVDQVTAIRLMRKFDQSKDKMLDAEEQKGAFLPLPAADFDENRDDKLEIMEVASMLAKYRRESGLSESDLQQIRALFTRFDTDADGTIDKAEFAAAQSQLGGPATGNPLGQFDTNKDGMLTQPELAKAMSSNRKKLGFNDSQLAEARRLLVRHDQNRDTFLDESELYDNPASGQLPKSLLKQSDQDKDQRISIVELAKYVAQQDEN